MYFEFWVFPKKRLLGASAQKWPEAPVCPSDLKELSKAQESILRLLFKEYFPLKSYYLLFSRSVRQFLSCPKPKLSGLLFIEAGLHQALYQESSFFSSLF